MNAFERNKMIEDNLPLVGYALNLLDYDKNKYEDYFQQGCLQLIRCVDNFKPENGKKFSTYAVKNIKWFLKEYIQRDFVIKPVTIGLTGRVNKAPCVSLETTIYDESNVELKLEDTISYDDTYSVDKSNIEYCLDKLYKEGKLCKRNYEIYMKRIIEEDKVRVIAKEYGISSAEVNATVNKVNNCIKTMYKVMFPEEYETISNSYNKSEEE